MDLHSHWTDFAHHGTFPCQPALTTPAWSRSSDPAKQRGIACSHAPPAKGKPSETPTPTLELRRERPSRAAQQPRPPRERRRRWPAQGATLLAPQSPIQRTSGCAAAERAHIQPLARACPQADAHRSSAVVVWRYSPNSQVDSRIAATTS